MELTLPVSSLFIVAISSVGVVASLVFGTMLIAQKTRSHLSVAILGALLVLSGLTLLNDMLVTSGITNRLKFLYFTPLFYSLSIPVLFYLFVKSKFRSRLRTHDLLHLIIPTLQAGVYLLVGFRSVGFKSTLYHTPSFQLFLQIEAFLFPVMAVVYTLLSLRLLRQQTSDRFFWSDDIKRWLGQFAMGMLIIAAVEFCFSLIEFSGALNDLHRFPLSLFHSILLNAFVLWIVIHGIKQYYPLQVFRSKPVQNQLILGDQELDFYSRQLRSLMQDDQVYLNPDLNLKLLAGYLDISEKACSFLLNQGLQTNFNTFINQYRIDAFKRRIAARDHAGFTLTSLAYDCGFDSKSTFNRVFKHLSGMTPSEYVKSVTTANPDQFSA